MSGRFVSLLALVVLLCACSGQRSPARSTPEESKGLFNAPCTSNADCQGLMCRSGRCH